MNFQHYTTWILARRDNSKTEVERVVFLFRTNGLDMI